MKSKITGLTASGSAHHEINPGDKWRDKRGEIVIIESNRFNRVTFYREGYPAPCVYPSQRFINEFQPVGDKKQ